MALLYTIQFLRMAESTRPCFAPSSYRFPDAEVGDFPRRKSDQVIVERR